MFVADTSVVVRLLRDRQTRDRWQPQVTAGVMGICPITEPELLHSARSNADREQWLSQRRETLQQRMHTRRKRDLDNADGPVRRLFSLFGL